MTRLRVRPLLLASLIVAAAAGWSVGPARAQGAETSLGARLGADAHLPAAPDATLGARLFGVDGPVAIARHEAPMPGWIVTRAGERLGIIASTWEVARSVGYSGRPIDILVAINEAARITGAVLVHQTEPVLTLNVTDEDIAAYVSSFAGFDLTEPVVTAFVPREDLPPVIARATVTTGVIRDAILRTARVVALGYGIVGGGAAGVDRVGFAERSWDALLAEGAIGHSGLSMSAAREAFAAAERPPEAGDAPFLEAWVALLDPPTIGRNLLGERNYTAAMAQLGPDEAALFLGSRGAVGHRGTAWRQEGFFDRVEVIQGERSFRLAAGDYLRLDELAAPGAPPMREMSLFRLGGASGFEPAEPFRVEITATRPAPDGGEVAVTLPVDYALPDAYRIEPPAPPEPTPLWVEAWRAKPVEIGVIAAALGVLFLILVFQDPFVRRPVLYRRVRAGYLSFTLVGIGWILGGQLSVVQVIAFVQAVLGTFRWETFLIEPVIFLIWSFVAMGLLFLGRGVFCGWLCPFGALQELSNAVARRLRVPQLVVPHALHERLWAMKYVLFMAILGLSFYSMEAALKLAEVEPFKTAITLRFQRAWPFVLFVLVLLGAGLFIERFFCRYLCPLGAALAIPGRLRMFDWLRRYRECGNPCMRCFNECPVQAIHPEGHINPNECISCLHCQVLYHHDRKCPVMIQKRLKREKRAALASPGMAPAAAGNPARREGATV
jgi:NosR/NirI family transcriptional regulator, nitrite reductase regulator